MRHLLPFRLSPKKLGFSPLLDLIEGGPREVTRWGSRAGRLPMGSEGDLGLFRWGSQVGCGREGTRPDPRQQELGHPGPPCLLHIPDWDGGQRDGGGEVIPAR